MADKFNNEGKVSLWERESTKTGNIFYSGVAYVGKVPYDIVIFENERTNDSQPVFSGKIELKQAK